MPRYLHFDNIKVGPFRYTGVLDLVVSTYVTGNNWALFGIELEEPPCRFTVNPHDYVCAADEVVIPNYTYDGDVYFRLREANVVEKWHYLIPLGYRHGYVCRLTQFVKDQIDANM